MIHVSKDNDKVLVRIDEESILCSIHDAKRLLALLSVVLDLQLQKSAQKQIDMNPEEK